MPWLICFHFCFQVIFFSVPARPTVVLTVFHGDKLGGRFFFSVEGQSVHAMLNVLTIFFEKIC